jgi:hypothetical protein
MKLKACLTLGVLLLCAMIAPLSRADETRDAKLKAEMVENYLLWQIAWKNKDAERIISFESPDYTYVSKDGQTQLKQTEDASLRYAMNAIFKIYDAKVGIKKITIEPHRVTVLSDHLLDADMIGPENRSHRVLITARSRDIWVNYDGAWMLKRTEEVDTKFLVDGKPER